MTDRHTAAQIPDRLESLLGLLAPIRGNGHRETPVTTAAVRAIKEWLVEFAACVRRKNFDAGRPYFHEDTYCFGSYASACEGRESLIRDQWMQIWPNITGFQFTMRELRVKVSHDGLLACAMVPWRSVGTRADGSPFKRNGRVTIVLTRPATTEPWRAFHTHYSLNPGTPQTNIPKK